MNGTTKYHHYVCSNTSGTNKNSCEANKNILEPENQQSQTRNKKAKIVGNIKNDLKIKHFKDLFGLETTRYLKKLLHSYCSPDHVYNELLKLDGIEFHGKSLTLEEVMFLGKKMNNNNKDSIINDLKLP